ncbi:MAG: S-adenosyl-l-methionine hydroxide adenosyltransferase family protein [Thermoleophilia bacterium]
MRIVCFYSDYGYTDDFVGVCHGVIKRLAPTVEVIDVDHGIDRQDVIGAAFVLRNTLAYMPDRAVHLAVVDPGVGGPRRAVALHSHGDRLFVGPDNGLLMLAVEADGGVAAARELTNAELWLPPLSATFHGRDIFSPVAARLAEGLPFDVVGAHVDPETLVPLHLPLPEQHEDGLTAVAVLIDRFGNVALNVSAEQLKLARVGHRVEVVAGDERYLAQVAPTFASVRPSDIVVLIDSYGQVAVAVNAGSAAEVLALAPGDRVTIRPRPGG